MQKPSEKIIKYRKKYEILEKRKLFVMPTDLSCANKKKRGGGEELNYLTTWLWLLDLVCKTLKKKELRGGKKNQEIVGMAM